MPELVIVATFSQPHEAHLACSAIRAAGLYATVADANIVAADWLYANAVGGVKVLVRVEDVAAAREVLDNPAAIDVLEDLASHGNAPVCPRCGSQDLESVQRGRRLAVLTWLLANVPLFPVWRRWRCRSYRFDLGRRETA